MVRAVSIPVIIAIGAVCSHLLFPMLHKPAQVAAQPLAVVTAWGWPGVAAWTLYAGTMLAAGVVYWFTLKDAHRMRLGTIALAVALAALAMFAFRFLLSSDVYAYAAYGALAATGQDPYVYHTFPPAQLVDAAWTRTIGFEWPSLPACVYGPAFLGLARAIVAATHFDLVYTLAILRLIEIVAFVALVVIAALAVPERGRLLAAIVGLNPVVISTVAEGHYDALVALVIAIAALVARRRPEIAGLIAGASVLLKATGAPAALALGYALASGRVMRYAAAGIVLAIGAQIVATQLAGGFQTVAATDFVGTGAAAFAIAVRGAFALALAIRALRCVAAGERAGALASAALLVWALYPQDYPWYGIWLLPLAAFTLHRREGPVLVLLTFTSTLRYLSDAYGFSAAAPWLELIAVVIPLAGFIIPLPSAAWRPGFAENTAAT